MATFVLPLWHYILLFYMSSYRMLAYKCIKYKEMSVACWMRVIHIQTNKYSFFSWNENETEIAS